MKMKFQKFYGAILATVMTLLVCGVRPSMASTAMTTEVVKHATPISELKTDGTGYYLYNVTNEGYIDAGGKYGMWAVLDEDGIGIMFTLGTKSSIPQSCIFKSSIANTAGGNAMAYDGYTSTYTLDKDGDNWGNWVLTSEDGTKFRMTLDGDKVAITGDNTMGLNCLRKTDGEGDEWVLVERDTYFEMIKEQFDNDTNQAELNVSNLVRNGRFIRNADNENGLFWYGYEAPGADFDGNYQTLPELTEDTDFYLGINGKFGTIAIGKNNQYAMDYGQYGTGELLPGKSGMLRQTIQVRNNGTYTIRAKAFYYVPGDTDPAVSDSYLFARTNGSEIPVISGAAKETFESIIADHKTYLEKEGDEEGDLAENSIDLFRNNVAAAEFLSDAAMGARYTISISLTVSGASEDSPVTVGFGAIKRPEGGYLFIDDVELIYKGSYEFGIDAYERNKDNLMIYDNEVGRRFNLRRKFNLNKWNALILPVNLYAGHVTSTFGEGAKVSKLKGLNPNNLDQLVFEPVDLSVGSNIAIESGEFYLVYVTREPETMTDYDFVVATGATDGGDVKKNVTYTGGNIYHFASVTSSAVTENTVTKNAGFENIPSNYTLTATGYYTRPANGTATAGDYVMSGGNMYHLTSDWNSLMGTCWKLRYTDNTTGEAKSFSVNIDGETTDILDVVTEKKDVVDGVYNLNGQKVVEGTSLEGLAKGVYVVNGKKVIVK